MPDYLSKEEIRQWRSSLEKITLEEFAARLGKVINEEKETRDIVDIVLEKGPVLVNESYKIKTEKINTIAKKALLKEREITTVRHDLKTAPKRIELEKPAVKEEKTAKPAKASSKKEPAKKKSPVKEIKEIKIETKTSNTDIQITFKKPLTEREQLVFNHFLAHKNSIVYAKDLAALLDLPRDYVYKYIKNLRTKIGEDTLENASNGGYMLKA